MYMKKKKKKIPWFLIIISLALIGGAGYFGYKKWQDSRAFKIEILIDEINVREEASLYSNKVGEVRKGQIYKVLDIDLEDTRYVWYYIKLQNGNYGWIATGRNNRYVKEINNPEGEGDEEFFADYGKPKIIFQENEITFIKKYVTLFKLFYHIVLCLFKSVNFNRQFIIYLHKIYLFV